MHKSAAVWSDRTTSGLSLTPVAGLTRQGPSCLATSPGSAVLSGFSVLDVAPRLLTRRREDAARAEATGHPRERLTATVTTLLSLQSRRRSCPSIGPPEKVGVTCGYGAVVVSRTLSSVRQPAATCSAATTPSQISQRRAEASSRRSSARSCRVLSFCIPACAGRTPGPGGQYTWEQRTVMVMRSAGSRSRPGTGSSP